MAYPTSIATKLDPVRTAKAVKPSRPSWELLPDEPIDPVRGGGSGRRLRKFALLCVILSGGAWGLWGEPSRWREWLPEGAVEQVSALFSRSTASTEAPSATSPQQEPASNRLAAGEQAADKEAPLELRADATLPSAEPLLGPKPNVLNKSADATSRPATAPPATSIGTACHARCRSRPAGQACSHGRSSLRHFARPAPARDAHPSARCAHALPARNRR